MDKNKRLAVNTIILYGKLVITTILGLFTSRIILNALGASDYGLYSVVGGIVTFMNVLGATMVSTSYRFLAIELGRGNEDSTRRIYNTVFLIHVLLAGLLIVVGETIGLYYVNNYLVVEPDKLADARFVLHISLLTTAISVVNVPATGLTIAREKFLFTSIVAIVHSVLKILLVLVMSIYGGNRLRMFSLIMLSLTITSVILYQIYCFKTSRNIIRFGINKDKADYKAIAGFTGWSTFGAVAGMGNNQGAAMIINYFFGTVLNAAYGIATQVNQYANVFIKSISQAAVPQIMKSYGEGDNARSTGLVYIISRLSSLALLLILVPLLLYTEEVLIIWLKEPPEYSVPFVRFLLINTFIAVLGSGFNASIQSTGNIKMNEIGCSLIFLLQLPVIFVLYYYKAAPYVNVIVLCIGTLITNFYQMTLLVKMTSFEYGAYFKRTIWPVLIATIVSFLPLLLMRYFVEGNVLLCLFISVSWTFVCVVFLGLLKKERLTLLQYLKKNKNGIRKD